MRSCLGAVSVLIAVLLCANVAGQTYKFRHFRTDDGIPQPFTYCIEQDDHGYLWIGTGKGLARFDGFGFTVYSNEEGLAEEVVTSSFKDSKGRIWFGHDQGGITILQDGRLLSLETPEELATNIIGFSEHADGTIWAASQSSGLLKIDQELAITHFDELTTGKLIQDILILEDDIILANNAGLLICAIVNGVPNSGKVVDDLLEKSVNCIAKDKNGLLWIGTNSNGVYSYSPKDGSVTFLEPHREGQPPSIQELQFDKNGDLWAATFGAGLIKCTINGSGQLRECVHFNSSNGAEHDHIKDVFEDREGNIWIAKFGDGIATLMNNAIVFYMDQGEVAQNVLAIEMNGQKQLIGTEHGLIELDLGASVNENVLEYENSLPMAPVTAIHTNKHGGTFIGTRNNGLFYTTNDSKFRPIRLDNDRLSSMITFITSFDDQTWVASRNGVYKIQNGKVVDHLNTTNGLSHNAVNHIFVDGKDRVWISTNNNGLTVVDHNEILQVSLGAEGEIFNVNSAIQDANGDLWVATYGNGLYRLKNGIAEQFSIEEGLHSQFCYSLEADNSGNIWVGHRGGITCVELGSGDVKVFDKDHGISSDMNLNALLVDENESIWFGTNNGMIRYDPDRDEINTVPPVVNITAVKVFDEEMDLSSTIELAPDIYKIRFEFLGVSMTNSDEVTYQYKLEGHDLEWSEPTQNNYATYNRVGSGELVFNLKACNSDGICTEQAILLPIVIRTPIWQRWWFLLGALVVVALVIQKIIKTRERNQRNVQEYLQRTLEERTIEVRAKSAEIEQKNKDITDSLNYAKHIQEAILPEDRRLKELFPSSFIFHQPRDIVSGDFYWFKRFGEKFVIACADATGHGVPGAFMSMIGSILLRDISTMRNVDSPDKLLNLLDSEVRALLKQRNDGITSNDGMDITICEIDLESRKIRTSSAMHSIFINRNGRLDRIKGDRHSIGGLKVNGSPLEFSIQEHDLEPGDKIYLFSDGLQDQFGGMDGKKLKIRGTVELLESIMHHPMDEQADLLRNKFRSWMNGFEQVDDVLFIGLQI